MVKRMIAPMPNKPNFPIRVFYDGLCSVCASEIEHYVGLDHGGRLLAVDISAPDFDPEPFGIPLAAFMYELYVIDSGGQIFRGVEAFWAIWQAFPASTVYGIMGAVITMPLVNPVARLLYKGFARTRRYLPKRHTCSSGTCHVDGKNQ
jgi:predicted DCC family thiol-disulfide oxidoreductase YuxK